MPSNASSKIHVQTLGLPLGNPQDISLRGIEALKNADRIFCEDTRKLQTLLRALNIETKSGCRLTSLPGSDEWNFDWSLLEKDSANTHEKYNVVLVSDAGTPIVNDPGRAITERALKEGWELTALPGPSALTLALQWCGGFGLPVMFYGFAPRSQGKDFEEFLARLSQSKTLVFFESRYNVIGTLEALVKHGLGERKIFLAREMTKTHEELWGGTVTEILEKVQNKLSKEDAIGELTFVLEGDAQMDFSKHTNDPQEYAAKILEILSLPPKPASKLLSDLTGISKQDAYKMLVDSKETVEKKK